MEYEAFLVEILDCYLNTFYILVAMLKYFKVLLVFALFSRQASAQIIDTTTTLNNQDSLLYFAQFFSPSNVQTFGNNRVIGIDVNNFGAGLFPDLLELTVFMSQPYFLNYSKSIRPTGPNSSFPSRRFRAIKTSDNKKLILLVDKIYIINLVKIENDFTSTGAVNLNTCIDTLPFQIFATGFSEEVNINLIGDTLVFHDINESNHIRLFDLNTKTELSFPKLLFYDAPNAIYDSKYNTITYFLKDIQLNKSIVTTLVHKTYSSRISSATTFPIVFHEDFFISVDLSNTVNRTVESIKKANSSVPYSGLIDKFAYFKNQKFIMGRHDSLLNAPSKGLDLYKSVSDNFNFNVKPQNSTTALSTFSLEYHNGLLFYNVNNNFSTTADSIYVLNPISKKVVYKALNNYASVFYMRKDINFVRNRLFQFNATSGQYDYYFFPSFPFPKDLNQKCLDQAGTIELVDETQNCTFNFQWKNPSNLILAGTTKTSIKYQVNNTLAGDTLIMTYTSDKGLVGTNKFYYVFKPNATVPLDTVLFCNPQKRLLKAKNVNTIINAYQWSRLFNNSISNTFDTITVNDTGSYQLKVISLVNGCTNLDTIKITPDLRRATGNAPIGQKLFVSCKDTITNVIGTSTTANASFKWRNQNTNVAYNNPLQTKVFGNYWLVVTDAINGCKDSSRVVNIVNKKITPQAAVVGSASVITTLTCNQPSVSFTGTSTTIGTQIKWVDNNRNVYQNPITITASNGFKLFVTDTILGCIDSSQFRGTLLNKAKPQFLNFQKQRFITCDDVSNTINATTSLSSQTTVIWKDINNTVYPNPFITSQPGKYFVQATDNINGCSNFDTVTLSLIPTLKFTVSNDTVICKGGIASLKATYKDPLNYTWSTGAISSAINVQPIATATYIVTGIKTSNGCTGKDTIQVTIADTIIVVPLAFKPCDPVSTSGTIKINVSGGIPPYQYALVGNASLPFSSINNYTNVLFGNYTAVVKDSIGCTNSKTVSLNSSSSLPIPKFILNTSATKGDTVVLVDITDPKPDSVKWIFPIKVQLINNSNPSSPVILIKDTGSITIGMTAFYPNCQIPYTRTIRFAPKDTNSANPNNNNGIESVSVSPNPNNGQFDLEVKLYKKQNFVVFINNINGGFNQQLPTQFNSEYFLQNILLSNATPGTYMIRVVSEFGSKQIKFIIN